MKTISMLVMALVLVSNAGAADTLTEKLQRGLFEEEANHNLDAAIKEYQSVVAQSDEQRKVIATALFRLGECYRKLGKTNEANAQYQRILRDFSEQEQLIAAVRTLLPNIGGGTRSTQPLTDPAAVALLRQEIALAEQQVQVAERKLNVGKGILSDVLQAKKDVLQLKRLLPENVSADRQRGLIEEQIGIVQKMVTDLQRRIETGTLAPDEAVSVKRELLSLQRELALAGAAPEGASMAQATTDEEEKEVRRIRAMIKDSPDLINARDPGGNTPLHRAANAGQLVVARFLIANKADVNAKNSNGETPLHAAAILGHKSFVELLIENGSDVNAVSKAGDTPLHSATGKGFRAVVEVLLAHQADVNAKGNLRETPLHRAVKNGFKSVAELLLDKGADVNAKSIDNSTPLILAALSANQTLVELLLSHGASVDAARNDGKTALSLVAALNQSLPIAKILLAKKADPNLADNAGTTPLSVATQNGASAIAEVLLANQANPNISDQHGITPLHWAALYGETAIAELLLKNNAAITAKVAWKAESSPSDKFGQPIPNRASPIYLAVTHSHQGVVEALLAHGADIDAVERWDNGYIQTLLHAAVGNNGKEMVKLLLEKKANPNLLNGDGWTPLMVAAARREKEIVELLLNHGADVNVLSASGQTALSLAESQSFPSAPPSREIGQILRQRGAIEDLQRSSSITVGRYSTKYPLFEKDTNGFNRFTLFEAIAQHYTTAQSQNLFAFPDFSRVKVKRLKGKTPNEEILLDLETVFKFGECAKDVWLEWGDLIEIPEQDHRVNEPWWGLPTEARDTLHKCLEKKVQVIVKGQTNVIALNVTFSFGGAGIPLLPATSLNRVPGSPEPLPESEIKVSQNQTGGRLNSVIRAANVIRSSSDLSRVKVGRVDPITGEKREMIFDLTQIDKRNDLWLRHGDVIEIPEKQ